jgi:cyclohexanone monooxygenase
MTSKDEQAASIQIDVDALNAKYEEERRKRLRSDANAQYQELAGAFEHFAEDPWAAPGFERDPIVEDTEVLIIGAGFNGLLAACRLRDAGVEDLRVVDTASDFGGTWYWNRYPGAACDVESYIYMPLLEETGYIPSEKYAKASELFEHCQRVGKLYDLYSCALFQTKVETMRWNEERSRWIVTTSRADEIAARFAVAATGLLSHPKLPGIPGIETFGGHAFHSSRWDYNYTGGDAKGNMTGLADKHVAIIGTGATGVQLVPKLGASAEHLYVFQRTPASVDRRDNKPTDTKWVEALEPGWQRQRMDNFTTLTSGGHQAVDLVDDGWTDIIKNVGLAATGHGPADIDPEELKLREMKKMERTRRRVADVVDDATTAEALMPFYHYFCKRPCFHDEYLPTFNRPNVSLIDTNGRGVEHITPRGLVVDGVEYPVDCIIFATGFDFMQDFGRESGLEVYGLGGQPLSERWSGGARTFYGLHTRGFPNFLRMSIVQAGVSVNYTHISDAQSKHVAHVVSQCRKRGVVAVEPTVEAEDGWVDEIITHARKRRDFLESCTPGYYNHEGRRDPSIELNDLYSGGPMTYIKIIEDWRADGEMSGLALSHQDSYDGWAR